MAPWNAIGFFCEDIRPETDNKLTLIGLFPDNLHVASFPSAILKIGILVRINVDVEADIGPVSAKIRLPDGTDIPLSGFDSEGVKKAQEDAIARGAPLAGFIISGVFGQLKIANAGRMLALVDVGEEKEFVCGA